MEPTETTKTCTTCGHTLPITSFHRKPGGKFGRQARCRECQSEYDQTRNGTPERKHRPKPRNAEARNYAYVADYLSTHPCVDCGESDPIVLEFDHVRGSKVANISEMKCKGLPLSTMIEEIAKCEVRCANCHRRVTFVRRNEQRTASGV